jgi:hypothetical protein
MIGILVVLMLVNIPFWIQIKRDKELLERN